MFSYLCSGCGAQWTVYAICFDCPFCHCMERYKAYHQYEYQQRLSNGTLPAKPGEKP